MLHFLIHSPSEFLLQLLFCGNKFIPLELCLQIGELKVCRGLVFQVGKQCSLEESDATQMNSVDFHVHFYN